MNDIRRELHDTTRTLSETLQCLDKTPACPVVLPMLIDMQTKQGELQRTVEDLVEFRRQLTDLELIEFIKLKKRNEEKLGKFFDKLLSQILILAILSIIGASFTYMIYKIKLDLGLANK